MPKWHDVLAALFITAALLILFGGTALRWMLEAEKLGLRLVTP